MLESLRSMVMESMPRVGWSESENMEGVELEIVIILGVLGPSFLSKIPWDCSLSAHIDLLHCL